MKQEYHIYGLYKKGALFYIGITKNLDSREWNHKRTFGGGFVLKVLHTRMVKDAGLYGISIKMKKIESALLFLLSESKTELRNKHFHNNYSWRELKVAKEIFSTI